MLNLGNVVSGGALNISFAGMAIVFCGLTLISLYIKVLPFILQMIDRIFASEPTGEKATAKTDTSIKEQEEKDLASVIGLVMQMEEAHALSSQDQEDIDIAHVIGLVLHLEQEQLQVVPN